MDFDEIRILRKSLIGWVNYSGHRSAKTTFQQINSNQRATLTAFDHFTRLNNTRADGFMR